ncbi:uncharacterized protein LOC107841498 [Capsicum annuum]|uniref:uncharacterized protein LOC107841498 n=1 Tax=Capsicum annuum TaxID=4072 RepID=UPI0007BF574A|nr:uncharacterized protein LOC107841498 [Capsicum annuum]
MAKYAIANGFNTKVKRSDKESLSDRVLNNLVMTTTFVSEFAEPKLINHKRIHTPADIIEEMKVVYGVDINYTLAWRAKEKMHKALDNEFKYLFIALHPMIRGFEFCQPVVVVGSAYLSGPYKGTFILASILDGADVKDYGRYCLELYRPNTIVKTCELRIVSMPDMKDWNVPQFINDEEVVPPKYRRPPGRPKKGRHLKSSESLSSSSNCYSKCGRAGHNQRTCDFFPKKT